MNRLDLLAKLQALDIRIEENARAQQQTQARLADDSRLTSAQAETDSAARGLSEKRARLRALELEVNGLAERIAAVEARLFGGRVTNPKELTGLEQDEVMLKRQKSELEDQMLEVMSAIESGEAQAKGKRATLEQVTAQRSAALAHDRSALQDLGAQAVELSRAREQLRAQIAAADLSLYDALQQEKRGRALARLKGTACSACGFAVPSGLASRARVGDELVFCANCGRILVP